MMGTVIAVMSHRGDMYATDIVIKNTYASYNGAVFGLISGRSPVPITMYLTNMHIGKCY